MYIWSKLENENIAKLQGFYEENGFPSFLSEWSEEGTVDSYVKDHPECDLKAIVSVMVWLWLTRRQPVKVQVAHNI